MSILHSASQVLRAYSLERPHLTVSDLSRLLNMPKSNASRLLRAMRDAGFLETVGTSKMYRPSALVLNAGRVYQQSVPLIMRADQVVSRISEESGHTGYVSKMIGRDVAVVADRSGTHALRVVNSIGRRLEAFASATGRSLLARMRDEDIAALYDAPFKPPSPNAPQNFDDLMQRITRVRREGYAESNDEANRGVGALAVAVGDPVTQETVSLCIAFPASTIAKSERDEILQSLLKGAEAIAIDFGDCQDQQSAAKKLSSAAAKKSSTHMKL